MSDISYPTKLDRIMHERGLKIATLNMRLRQKKLPVLDPCAFGKYRRGKTGMGARLTKNSKYPSVLERLCIALDCHSSDLMDY